MAFRFDHIHLRSRDAAAAARFYVDMFGASERRRIGDPLSRVVIDLCGVTVFIEQMPALSPGATPPHLGLEHIGITVDDIEAEVGRLAERGITLASGITQLNPNLRVAFFDGPDHVRIELLERV